MEKSTLGNYVTRNALIWWIGWITLALVEVGLRLTLSPPPLILMTSITFFVYSLTGIILGALYGSMSFLLQPLVRRLHGLYSPIEFSMAASIGTTVFLYALVFFIRVGLYENTPSAFLKSVLFFGLGITALFLPLFFFRWMDRKGSTMVTYISLLPSLWIITSLKLNRNKELLPRGLHVTTVLDHLLLILCAVLCFFLLYVLISFVHGWLRRRGGAALLPLCLIILSAFFLFLSRSVFPGDGDNLKNEKKSKMPRPASPISFSSPWTPFVQTIFPVTGMREKPLPIWTPLPAGRG